MVFFTVNIGKEGALDQIQFVRHQAMEKVISGIYPANADSQFVFLS